MKTLNSKHVSDCKIRKYPHDSKLCCPYLDLE